MKGQYPISFDEYIKKSLTYGAPVKISSWKANLTSIKIALLCFIRLFLVYCQHCAQFHFAGIITNAVSCYRESVKVCIRLSQNFFTSKTSIVILYVSFNWLLIQIILFTETPLQQVTLQNYNQLTWAKVNWNLYTLSSLTHTHTYTYVCGIKRRGISFWVTFVSDFGINIVKLL